METKPKVKTKGKAGRNILILVVLVVLVVIGIVVYKKMRAKAEEKRLLEAENSGGGSGGGGGGSGSGGGGSSGGGSGSGSGGGSGGGSSNPPKTTTAPGKYPYIPKANEYPMQLGSHSPGVKQLKLALGVTNPTDIWDQNTNTLAVAAAQKMYPGSPLPNPFKITNATQYRTAISWLEFHS